MQNKSQTQKQNNRRNGVTFFCNKCNSVGKVLVECWTDNSDGPYKIELIQHENLVAKKVEQIDIHKKPKGEIYKYHFCGHCGNILNKPLDSDFVAAIIRFNTSTPKN